MLGFGSDRNQPSKEITINVESLETRVAIMHDKKLEEFYVEHPSEERIVGSIYKGRIQNLEDGLQAAFIDIGMAKNAFIHYWDMIPEESDIVDEDGDDEMPRRTTSRRRRYTPEEIAKRFPVGSDIVVQVSKGPISTKGPRVTANLSIPGRYLVLMPGSKLKGVSRKIEDARERERLKKVLRRLPVPENAGLIVRTAGSGTRKTSFVRDMRALSVIWEETERCMRDNPSPCCLYQEPGLVERIVRDSFTEDIDLISVDSEEVYNKIREMAARFSRRIKSKIRLYKGATPIFEYFDTDRQLENALRRKVNLKSGGYCVFDETEALIAIDVNTARHKGSKNQEDAIFEVNSEAVDEVARQLRLRNLGGLIVIDLIDMKQRKHQNSVYRKLKDALRDDRARTNVLPISKLGLIEMTRQRMEESHLAQMHTTCPYCSGRGSVKSALTMSILIQRHISEILRRHRDKGQSLKLLVVVYPKVLDRLRREDEKILVELEKKYDGYLSFKADAGKHMEEFVILNAETGEKLYSSR